MGTRLGEYGRSSSIYHYSLVISVASPIVKNQWLDSTKWLNRMAISISDAFHRNSNIVEIEKIG